MLVILAHDGDTEARRLARRWRKHKARLVTPANFARSGWRYVVGDPAQSQWMLPGGPKPVLEFCSVLVRTATVGAEDLPHIQEEDRSYVAAELTAMLAAWLQEMPCSMLNRPTPLSLLGPAWTHTRWLYEADRSGVPVHWQGCRSVLGERSYPPLDSAHLQTVTVVGKQCFGGSDPVAWDYARRLATAAGVGLMTGRFALEQHGPIFLEAWPSASLSEPATADAVLAALTQSV